MNSAVLMDPRANTFSGVTTQTYMAEIHERLQNLFRSVENDAEEAEQIGKKLFGETPEKEQVRPTLNDNSDAIGQTLCLLALCEAAQERNRDAVARLRNLV